MIFEPDPEDSGVFRGYMGEPGAEPGIVIPALRSVLNDSEHGIRYVAIEGLSRFGSKAEEAAPDLLAISRDPEERQEVRQLAERALWNIALGKIANVVAIQLPGIPKPGTIAWVGLLEGGPGVRVHDFRRELDATDAVISCDPRGKTLQFYVRREGENLAEEFEVVGLPPRPEPVWVEIEYRISKDVVYLCARENDRGTLLELRKVVGRGRSAQPGEK